MQIVFLGTSGMVPTKDRNVSSVYLKFKEEGILFDCGEGTQRQMNVAGIKRTSVTKIFITHWHGDHVAGIIGLIQTLGAEVDNEPKLEIFGPKGTVRFMKSMLDSVHFDNRVDIKIHEFSPTEPTLIYEDDDYFILSANMIHSTPCIGFSFVEKDKRKIRISILRELGVEEGPHLKELQEGKSITYNGKKIDVDDVTTIKKGKKITYIVDTKPCENATLLADGSDLLICEATFLSDLDEKAEFRAHMTSKDAALLANHANVEKLILTHFSQRYKTVDELLNDAKTYFDNVECAYDFMKINL